MDSTSYDLSRVLIELGLVVIGLAILARVASRWVSLPSLFTFWLVSLLAMEDWHH